ncbi:putative MATE family efflux protein [Kitasatospora acidiphila]
MPPLPSPRQTRRALLTLGLPVYGELLSGVVAGVIDTAWLARLGASAVGAAAVATTTENVLLGVILMANVGTTVLLAEAQARGRRDAPPLIARAAAILWLAITPLVAVGGFLLRHQLAGLLVGADAETARLTGEFYAIAFPGIAVFFAQNVVDGIFKGMGDTRTPMRTALLANGCVLVLDPLLIYGAHLGVRGAALALVLGRAIALVRSLTRLPLRPKPSPVRELAPVMRRLLAVGLPASGDFVVRMGIAMSLVGIVARFGEGQLAAYGIGTKVILFITMACYAVRQAASILTARHSEAHNTESARDLIARQAVLVAMAVAAAGGLALALCGRWVLAGFTDAPGVLSAGAVLLRYLVPYLVLLAGVVALGGVFLGGGRSRTVFGVTLLGAVVQLPLAYGLSAVPALGVRGVWLSMSLGTGAQLLLLSGLFGLARLTGPAGWSRRSGRVGQVRGGRLRGGQNRSGGLPVGLPEERAQHRGSALAGRLGQQRREHGDPGLADAQRPGGDGSGGDQVDRAAVGVDLSDRTG